MLYPLSYRRAGRTSDPCTPEGTPDAGSAYKATTRSVHASLRTQNSFPSTSARTTTSVRSLTDVHAGGSERPRAGDVGVLVGGVEVGVHAVLHGPRLGTGWNTMLGGP